MLKKCKTCRVFGYATGRLRVNGTPVHYDSFINNLLTNYEKAKKGGKDFAWNLITYKAILPSGESLWPSFFDKKVLKNVYWVIFFPIH